MRGMATLWLHFEQNVDFDVFSWDNNESGVTRANVNKVLKASAVTVGIAGGDVASHSCRVTGLSRLLAQKMDFRLAREFGRWSRNRTCVLKYFWPHTTLARDFAASIWEERLQSSEGRRGNFLPVKMLQDIRSVRHWGSFGWITELVIAFGYNLGGWLDSASMPFVTAVAVCDLLRLQSNKL